MFQHEGRLGQCGPFEIPDLVIYLLLIALQLLNDEHTFLASSTLERLALLALRKSSCNIICWDAYLRIE